MGCGTSKRPSLTPNVNNGEVAQLTVVPSPSGNSISHQEKLVKTEAQKHIKETHVGNSEKEDQGRKAVDKETVTMTKANQLTILHFNDVYNIEPREKEPVGGAARFATKLASFKHLSPLVVFSGDCLNPSTMSSVTQGKQMIPILNALNVNIAVLGNHDFDFGVDELVEFCRATNFPWLMSNVIDNTTNRQLAEGKVKWMAEWSGRKIGFIGLVEEEWLVTLATVDREEVTYFDFVTEGTKLAKELKDEGAELVIALTHMRVPNDCRLAQHATGIDLILGGHDHDYYLNKINGVQIVKSGTDFRELSCITVKYSDNNNFNMDIERVEITSDVPEDPHLKLTVDKFVAIMDDMMEEVIGEVEVDLDGRFSSIRTRETNLGNFVTDIMQNVTEADIVILNSGTFRSDTVHHPGPFKMKDLKSILPMPDVLVVLELTGDQVLQALENGVSQWPKLEGRFPQVAGIAFTFNPKEEPGFRIVKHTVHVDGEPINTSKTYKVCTKLYLANGKDGYEVFTKSKVLVDEEDGPILNTIVRNHFHSINIVRGVTKSKSSHRQSLVMRRRSTDMIHDGSRRSSQELVLSLERKHTHISPQVEGRITILTGESLPLAAPTRTVEGSATAANTTTGSEEEMMVLFTEQVQKTKENTSSSDGRPEQPVKEDITDENMSEAYRQEKERDQVQTANEGVTNGKDNSAAKTKDQEVEQQLPEKELKHETVPSQEKLSDDALAPVTDNTSQLGPDLASEDEYWDLWEAVKIDDSETVTTLRQEKNIRFTRFQDNKTMLHLGAERNAVKVLEYLLTEGKMDPNIKDEILQGVPLHGAAEYGSVSAAAILLKHGAEINKQDLIGNSALHIACEHDQADMKKFLVDQGADATLLNSDGEKPTL